MVVDLRVDEAEFKDDEGISLMERDLQVNDEGDEGFRD